MRKKVFIGLLVMVVAAFTGCGNTKENIANVVTEQQEKVHDFEQETREEFIKTQNNIKDYKIQGDSRFEPVSYQRIDDGSIYGVLMIVYKDTQNNEQYLYVESDDGISFTPIN